MTDCVFIALVSVHYVHHQSFGGIGFISLRVVDASSMPIVPNGHPMSTIIMLAHRAVDFIVNDEDAAL